MSSQVVAVILSGVLFGLSNVCWAQEESLPSPAEGTTATPEQDLDRLEDEAPFEDEFAFEDDSSDHGELESLLSLDARPGAGNILGSHIHHKGELMVGYMSMTMDMDGLQDGSEHDLSRSVVLDNYMVTPVSMRMEMHGVMLMYAPTDSLTLMAMTHYQRTSMKHETRMGQEFTTRTSGMGDSQIGLSHAFFDGTVHKWVLNASVSLPTGSVSALVETPAGTAKAPYPMQLGSGTFDLLPGITYLGLYESFQWGAQLNGTIRLGNNDQGYRLGDALRFSAWARYAVTDWFAPGLRVLYSAQGDVIGEDEDLNPNMVPTADPNLQKRQRLDLIPSLEFALTRDTAKPVFGRDVGEAVLIFELHVPVYQYLKGPQLETDWILHVGIQWTY